MKNFLTFSVLALLYPEMNYRCRIKAHVLTRKSRKVLKNFPGHKMQSDVTKKIAFVYRSDGRLEEAAGEYERIAREANDDGVRRGSLDIAAELYRQTGTAEKELSLYKKYVVTFPTPLDQAMDIYYRMAGVYKKLGKDAQYKSTLKELIRMYWRKR